MKYIESVNNPKVKAWKKLLTKKERDQSGHYLIEGFHLVEEALKEQIVLEVCEKRMDCMENVKMEKLLLLDRVQDPGNLGTLIRTADAAGVDAIILGAGCADPYNPKVVRATQGSLFHLPLINADLSEFIDELETPVISSQVLVGISMKGKEFLRNYLAKQRKTCIFRFTEKVNHLMWVLLQEF